LIQDREIKKMRRLTVLTLIAVGASLSACGTSNRGMESVHQPVVARADYIYDLPAPTSDSLSENDASRLAGWFDSVRLRYGDRVSVDAPGDYGSARNAVGAIVARYGLLVDTQAPVTQGDIAAGSMRVIISRMTASVPNCPDWSRPASPEFGGSTISNYGCAINSNLAAMVADPQDLIHGREGPATADATTAGKAIRTYRAATPTGATGLKNQSTRGN
jgi:pilus assembly protein CpaD